MLLRAVSLVCQAEPMPEPGANRSRQAPKFENEGRVSLLPLAPTVSAAATRAGELWQASAVALPAAIAYVTPAAIELTTARSRAFEMPPPRLMLATAGRTRFFVTHSTPAITPELVPVPVQPSTRTACSVTAFAMPCVEPPIVPATCVPCPLQSFVPWPSLTAEKPLPTRPLNSTCVARRPV